MVEPGSNLLPLLQDEQGARRSLVSRMVKAAEGASVQALQWKKPSQYYAEMERHLKALKTCRGFFTCRLRTSLRRRQRCTTIRMPECAGQRVLAAIGLATNGALVRPEADVFRVHQLMPPDNMPITPALTDFLSS